MAFTDKQLAAVKARGKVFVSASAGAGKTTVMIKRLADILADGASLDNVLAVTFTKKAAAQMKEKLRAELISRLSETEGGKREHLRAQLGKINSSDISTIHSFCARLVRTYFYAFDGVDASFEIIADGTEVSQLQNRALDNLFDRLYGKSGDSADRDFLYLVDRLKRRRSDAPLREALLSAYARLRIEPNYTNIAERTERTFSAEGFEKVCARLGELIGRRCAFYSEKVEEFAKTLTFSVGGDGYFAVLDEMRESLNAVAKNKNIFVRNEKLNSTSKPRVKRENAEEDARFAEFVKGVKKRYEALFKDVGAIEDERAAFDESGALARAFVSVLLQLDSEYAAIKREEGKLDYGDLEHFAYALVCGDAGADSDVKAQINAKYGYVFVDEYQDVNPIQDAIINAVASGDCFKVGDVKQAIYGFRGSRSHFFGDRLKEAASENNCIILPHNFRSSGAVINLVNGLFSKIMTSALCGYDYVAENHVMESGISNVGGGGAAQFCTFEKDERKREGAVDVYDITAQSPQSRPPCADSIAVVNLIDELLQSEMCDCASGEIRRIQQGDICVLTRKKNSKSISEIERALLAEGYNVDGASQANVCDRAEIKQLLNVLSYLDNGEQDIALASALLSPLGELSENDLALVRVYGGVGRDAPPFRRCAEKYAREKEDGTAGKLRAFYDRAGRLRRLAEVIGAARLIDEIIKEGVFVAIFSAEDKLAAVRRLQNEAYSSAGELSLNAFLAKLKLSGYKVNAPVLPSSDSIKIMTMHSSKGLEFPVVVLADIAASFSGDTREEMPYDEEFGFAPRFYDGKSKSYGGTLLRKLSRLRSEEEELKNEINLFYVACTRAQNSLYILTSKQKAFDCAGVLTADSYADLFDIKMQKNAVQRPIYAGERVQNSQKEQGTEVLAGYDGQLYKDLNCALNYPVLTEQTQLPVKSSATKILNLHGDEEVYPVMFEEREEGHVSTGVDSGIAYHAFLQLCDFEIKNKEGIQAQIERLNECGKLSTKQVKLLDVGQLYDIVNMPQFNFDKSVQTFREREFLLALSASEYASLTGGTQDKSEAPEYEKQSVIIQGAIDLLAVTRSGDKVVRADIIDYKYSARSDSELKEKYAPQLALYKKAVAKVYNLGDGDISTQIINIRACRAFTLDV